MVFTVADDVDKQYVVISDDTNVFILLLYFYNFKKIFVTILIESPVQDCTQIDIEAFAIQYEETILILLEAHSITGYDFTVMFYRIAKIKPLMF